MEINKNSFEIVIDTSTPNSLIALLKDSQILSKCEWASNNNESKTLLPNINYLIKKNNLNIQSCSKIFVVIGPGGFSSLRIGVSTAKGLSIILGIPLIPIPTLLSSAMEFITENYKVMSITECSKGTFYSKVYNGLQDINYKTQKEYISFEIITANDILNFSKKENTVIASSYTNIKTNEYIKNNKLENCISLTSNKIQSIIRIEQKYKAFLNNLETININPVYANSGQISSALTTLKKGE